MSEASAPSLAGGRLALAPVRVFPAAGSQADLSRASGFLVVDPGGRLIGRVEGPTFGASIETPAALTVSFGFLWLRRCIVGAASIEQIDDGAKVVGLRIDRRALRAGRA